MQLRTYLGLISYYRYIKNNTIIVVQLTNSLKGKIKKEKIVWNEECDRVFEQLNINAKLDIVQTKFLKQIYCAIGC